MTTDRTQPARPAALNDRSSAAPAERRPEGAFAALLDAQAPAPRREEVRRDDVRDRGAQPREAGHDQPHDTALQPHDAAPRHDQAAHGDQRPAVPQAPAAVLSPESAVAAPAAQPVVIPPFVATMPAEAPTPAAAAPALPVPPAPLFMAAPEAVTAVVPASPQPAAPAAPAELPAAAAPQPVATTPAAPAQPTAAAPAEPAPAAPQPHEPAPAAAAPQAPVAEAKAQETELPAPIAEPAAASEPHVATPARAAVAAEPAPAGPSVQGPAVEPPAQAPVSTSLSAPAAPERTVPLHRAPAAVATLLHVAVDRGITHARMALRPAELGGIEIRLQATAGGIAAQVVADSPEAARLLAQAGDDLRRALEARDVTLISLEVSTSGDQRQHNPRGEWTDGDDAGLNSSPDRTTRDGDAEPVPTTQTVIELPGGLLVDVLA
jgi:hypothetical protein